MELKTVGQWRQLSAWVTLAIVGLLLGPLTLAAQSAPVPSAPLAQSDKARLAVTYAKLPLSFEANQGQAEASVKFLARGRGYSLFLSPSEAVLLLAQPEGQATGARPQGQVPGEPRAQALSSTLRMTLVDAQPAPQLTGGGGTAGHGQLFHRQQSPALAHGYPDLRQSARYRGLSRHRSGLLWHAGSGGI